MFDNWINEWEYPNIGIPFGETQTAGHDMYFMDLEILILLVIQPLYMLKMRVTWKI